MDAAIKAAWYARLVVVILEKGIGGIICADHLNDYGRFSVDPDHVPNSKQNSIGPLWQEWKRKGIIEATGRHEPSQNPYRHASSLSQWRITEYGYQWALEQAGADEDSPEEEPPEGGAPLRNFD